jgi:hypothetical protein
MRKTHGRSIVLGIGIGMIITSIAGLIFANGTTNKMTMEEIINQAKIYGMVEKTSLIQGDSSTVSALVNQAQNSADPSMSSTTAVSNNTASSGSGGTSSQAQNSAVNSSNSQSSERNIDVEIKTGDDSQKVAQILIEKGIIKSEKVFNDELVAQNAETKIMFGKYKFKKNDDISYVVKAICEIK